MVPFQPIHAFEYFHIVAAVLGQDCQEMKTFSKDGYRPVIGLGDATSYMPLAKEPYKTNDSGAKNTL
jgi:hypothetical protein